MLRNCEEMKMVLISSTTNEWPQIDDQNLMASTNMGMEKASEDQIQQQQQQAVLKCPRCDSTNTKFCYYNNYSLSQPRHFCKACKRYWTRGGTLRNVPVGGGCRKNKRFKRPPPASASATAVDNSPSSATTPMSTTSPSTTINPLFYNIHSNSELNLSFPRFNSNSTRVDTSLVYDFDHLHPLGFSSGQLMANDVTSQTLLSSSYNSIPNFGSLSSIVSASPTMASLLASSVQQQKFIPGNSLGSNNNFLEFGHYEDDMQMQGMKEVKMEECQNRLNQIQQIESADPNSVFWSANGVGSWLDPANIGSNSVSSLI